ncbi:MAG TPA: hypothetical protein V6D03_00510, partial [Candidatus Caenarcaniphilales bacterium]
NLAYLHLLEPSEADLRHGGTAIPTSHFRPIFQGRLMTNGGYDRQKAEAAIASGQADLVSFGTLFIANPDLPERFRLNAPLNRPDPASFYGGDEKGYIDYPVLQLQPR